MKHISTLGSKRGSCTIEMFKFVSGEGCLKDAGGNFAGTNGGGAGLAAGLVSFGASVVRSNEGADVELDEVVIARRLRGR